MTRPRRARVRAVLLIASVPLAVVALAAVIWLVRPVVVGHDAVRDYERGRFDASAESSGSLTGQWIVEPWIPYFDRGDALAAEQDYVRAIDDFEKALTLAPDDRECVVRTNLARAWTTLADEYEQGGYHEGAVKLYAVAQSVIDAAGERCRDDQMLQQTQQDIEQGRQQAQDNADAAPDDGAGRDEQGKLDALGQREQQGGQEVQDGDARDRGGQGGASGPVEKPW
ncbi:tetratricopeptide repeat protein [Galbitalea sp. SE-J8]|uniref:tetratricopeptide repeat protein n=1 Tax=Galbitalea sp. SE-J8 TaxID=3054952 RepID=UPI00259C7F78|nr:tetratricopeptide repeat protein [Galbitalea sp. SE-J8]MDM4763502.1 tetratricopeptide repeat protein [Galbitalea sp. SE-J8]